MGRVCVGPGLSRATFCPSGETHTSFCPGIHVSGMFVSIVVIFCPGGAGIWLGAAALPYTCGERRMPCHTRSLRGGKIADVKLKPAEVSLASRAVHVYRTTSIHGVEAPGQNSDTYTALGWSRRTTVHAPWAHREAAWAAEEPPTREAGHALDTHHAHTAN